MGDVAARAGVSVATASVAITGKRSGNSRVSPSVAERVRRAARQLNYRPNIQARNLSTRRTQTVAVLVKRSTWHNAMFYLASAQRALRTRGYTEIFLMHQDDRLESERAHLELCLERHVEGILILPVIDLGGGTNGALINDICEQEQIPVVQLEIAVPGCVAPAAVTDESGGFAQVVRHLHALGHTRIAHTTLLGYADDNPLNPFRHAHLRYRGYRAAMGELGLAEEVYHPAATETSVDSEFQSTRWIGHRIGSQSRRPTALVSYSDFGAAGLLAGLGEQGVRVPDEVSIVGYGDQPFVHMTLPALTTLAPAYETIGERATQMLLSLMDGATVPSEKVPAELICRQSVAAPPR